MDVSRVRKKTEQILNALGYNNCELSVVLMDDDAITGLNRTYRGIDKPTNVLSFPMQEGECAGVNPGLLGDLVISIPFARREAIDAGIKLEERLSQLLVHGILHLVGFDHEKGEKQAETMTEKSLELLRIIEDNTLLDAF